MGSSKSFDRSDVAHIAQLAGIPVSGEEAGKLAAGFTSVMAVVDLLGKADIRGVEPAHQVTGLENVFREDEIDEKRMLTQAQALANAGRIYNGFFVVPQILDRIIEP